MTTDAPPRLALLDYDAGNLRSVARALETTGAHVQVAASADALTNVDAVILPGQGHFRDCAQKLAARGLWEPVKAWLAADRPFLGICVGYQLLFEGSEEAPGVPGLGCFGGRVRRFVPGPGVKVPHMGWNSLQLVQPDCFLWRDLPESPSAYFCHSFYPEPTDPTLAAARVDYGGGAPFAAALARGNVAAVQFHPEKSQRIGLAVLRNFVSNLPARG